MWYEKPCAIDSAEFRKIEKEANTSSKLFIDDLWTLLLPSYQKMINYNLENYCGQAKHLSASFGYLVSESTYPQLLKAPEGEELLASGVYLISLSLHLLGNMEKTAASFGLNSEAVDTNIGFLLNYSSGACSQLTGYFNSMLSIDISLGCENGSIHISLSALDAEVPTTQLLINSTVRKVCLPGDGSRQKVARKPKSLSILWRVKNSTARNFGEYRLYGKNQYIPKQEHFRHLLRPKRIEGDQVPHELSLKVLNIAERLKEA